MGTATAPARPGRHRRSAPPALPVIAAVLTLIAAGLRWRAVSDDGLLFDDAWVSLGATGGEAGDLLSVSTLHPGFTALLLVWARIGPGTTTWMTLPAFVAGAALPAVLLWALRRLGVRRVIAVGVAALAVVAPTHVIYSGRVKPYTVEVVAVVLIAVVLGPLSRRRWSVGTAAAWVAAAIVLGSLNAFSLVVAGVATVVLVLHPQGDRAVRVVAAVVQAGSQAALLVWMRRSFDYEALEAGWGETFDGYVQLSLDPVATAREVATHLSRVGQVVVVDSRWLALALVVAGLAGLASEAWRGRCAVAARFLLALPLVALGGSVVEVLPFGTIDQTALFPGTRASLWLLPSVLVGLAFAAERVVARARGWHRPIQAVAVAVVIVAAGVVGAGALRHDVTYPAPGAETVAAVVEGRGDDDLVFVLATARWSLAAVEGMPFEVAPNADSMVGYDAVASDPAVVVVEPLVPWAGSPNAELVAGGAWERVFVVNGAVGVFDVVLDDVDLSLRAAGYERTAVAAAGTFEVETWERVG